MSNEIVRKRGDTKPIVFQLWQKKAAGTVLPIEGFSFRMTVDPDKDPVDSTNNLFSLTGDNLGSGKVQFVMTKEQADIVPGTYYYDFEITDDLGYISTPIKEKFKITQDITK